MSATAQPAPSDAIRLIERQDDFERLLEEMRGADLLAVDTEAASFHKFRDRVYLLQLSTRDITAVVDPLAVTDMSLFGRMLADPAVEIVFHDADYDVRLLHHEYQLRPNALFDTRIAAQLLNEPGVGLAALLEKYFGLKLDKRYQRADWSARPLSEPMLAYAAADTHHLPQLRDILKAQLEERGRWSWAEEEFGMLTDIRWHEKQETDEPGWLRMKGAKVLKGLSLAVLRELWLWRDGTAERLDKAAFRILNNEPMLELATAAPTDLTQLAAVKGIGGELLERRGKELLKAVERARALPESEWPTVPRPVRRAPDPAYEARLDALKSCRNTLAKTYDLQPGVMCPNGILEGIARLQPTTVAGLSTVPGMRRWQVAEFGQALLDSVPVPPAV